jgi:hypothetical protein
MLLSHAQTNSRRALSLPRVRLKIGQVRSQVRSVKIERSSSVDWIRMAERSRKPKYDFKNLDSQHIRRRAVMPDERRLPRQKDRSCQRFQLFPSSTTTRLFVRRPASF